jgi:hypothetical protein
MKHRIPTFLGGLLGGLLVYAALIARNWGELAALTAGNDKGVVIVVAVAVIIAVLSGVLALAVYPKHFGVSMLLGVLVPLGFMLGGIPRMGISNVPPAEGEKPSPLPALWFPLSPIESVAAGAAAEATLTAQAGAREMVDQERRKLAKEQDTLLKQAEDRVQKAADAARARALTDQQTTLEALHKQTLNASQGKWAREREQLTGERDRAATRATEAEATVKVLEEKQFAALDELRALRDAGKMRDELETRATRAETDAREATAAADQARAAAADYQRVFAWYLREAKGAARPVTVLGKLLTSQDAEERLTAARLLSACGAEAKTWLQRALNDSDERVRDAAKASLAKLG